MQELESLSGLVVQQRKEWGEILTGFEGKNKYVVWDTGGNEMYMAVEDGGNMLLRLFLKALRPFTMSILTPDGQPVMRLDRPFRFYFHEISIHDASGALLGTVKRRFSLVRRLYTVLDAVGREVFELFGPILHPWTFEIRERGVVLGKITKKWSGMGKEMFTDADNFGVTFPPSWDPRIKAVFLGAVFLIDFVHFESKGND